MSFSLKATFYGDSAPLISSLEQAKSKANSIGTQIGGGLRGALAGGLAAVASVSAIQSGISNAVEYAGRIADISNRLNISTDAVQEWDFALKQNGSSIEQAIPVFARLGINMRKALEGNAPMIAHFKNLGFELDALRGKKSNDILEALAPKFEDPNADQAKLQSAFIGVGGRGADNLVASMRDGIPALIAEYRAAMLGMDADTVDSLDKIGDQWNKLQLKLQNSVFAPMAVGLIKIFDFVKEHGREAIATFAGPFLGMLAGIMEFDTTDLTGSIKNIGIKTAMGPENMRKAWAQEDSKEAEADQLKADRKRRQADRDPDAIENKKAKNNERELEHIKKATDEEVRRGKLAAMNSKEKADFLTKEIEDLKKRNALETDPVAQAKNSLEIARRENELSADQRKIQKEDDADAKRLEKEVSQKVLASKNSVNSLQQIGGFVGGYVQAPEVAVLDVQKRSEKHLSSIKSGIDSMRKGIDKLSRGTGTTDAVQY